MKNSRQIIAILGVVLLVAMYASTLVFALIDSPWSLNLFKISIACTIFIPVFLYMYTLFYKRSKDKRQEIEYELSQNEIDE